jgi:hypothetical protein
VDRRGGAGKMIDPIHFDEHGVDDIMSNQFKVGMSEEMPDIVLTAGEKIIDTDDVFASIEKCLTEMAA